MELKRLFVLLLILALFVSNLVSVVRAEDDDDVIEEDEDVEVADDGADDGEPAASVPDEYEEDIDEEAVELKPSPDINTVVYFPQYNDKKFPQSTEITALVGLTNTGSRGFNLTSIQAYFHSPFDYTYYIQNFTVRELGVSLDAGKQVTLEYTFRPASSLDAVEFWLSGFVNYNSSDNTEQFVSYFTNSTVELVERAGDANIKRIFTYFLALAAAGLVGYIGWNLSSPPKSGRAQRKAEAAESSSSSSGSSAASSGTTDGSGGSDEWLTGVYKQAAKSRAVGKSGKRFREKPSAVSPKAAAPQSDSQ